MNTETTPSELASQALAQLAEALQAGKSEALTTYLKVMSRFTKYSWGNCLLISMQRPDASHVAGFHSWLGLGRHVRKGEKGIVILAPVVSKGKYSKDKQAAQDDAAEGKSERRLVAFRKAYVFALEQTDGDDLPQFATVQGDPQHHLDSLKALITSQDINLEFNTDIAPARGMSQGNTITLIPGMPTGEQFSTLVHEYAHQRLHKSERRAQTNKTIRETEAEAVAFVVCHAIGLDVNSANADYISLYAGDTATLSASLHFIQSTAADILAALQSSEEAGR
jgi:antirestriction protein ArdC